MQHSMRIGFRLLVAVGAGTFLASCGSDSPTPPDPGVVEALTITTQHKEPTQMAAIGTTQLGLSSPRDGFLYVPSGYDHSVKRPLAVFLHGHEDANATSWDFAKQYADVHDVIMLAIDSRFATWDIIEIDRYGPDVDFLELALEFAFDRVNVDPERISILGFSDGASEALGIGIANAGLFRRVFAFSPGALAVPFSRGFPRILVSHGDEDVIRSYLNTRDFIVPRLRDTGFTVEFIQFEGGHVIPADVMERAFVLVESPVVQ